MTEQTPAPGCPHQKQLQELAHRSDHAYRRGSHLGPTAALMAGQQVMAECKSVCGDASPYRDVELAPITVEAAPPQRP